MTITLKAAILAALNDCDQKLNDPKGDGSGDGATPPDGEHYNSLQAILRALLADFREPVAGWPGLLRALLAEHPDLRRQLIGAAYLHGSHVADAMDLALAQIEAPITAMPAPLTAALAPLVAMARMFDFVPPEVSWSAADGAVTYKRRSDSGAIYWESVPPNAFAEAVVALRDAQQGPVVPDLVVVSRHDLAHLRAAAACYEEDLRTGLDERVYTDGRETLPALQRALDHTRLLFAEAIVTDA